MNLVTFYGNKVGNDLVVVRESSLPNGCRPQDAVGTGYHILRAPDSERARSLLASLRASENAELLAAANRSMVKAVSE